MDNASEAQKIFSSIKTKIAERAIHSNEYDMYHISFSTKNTNIDLGITNDSNLYLVLAGYRASDLKSIGLEKYAETPPILKIWKVFDWQESSGIGILTIEPLSWFHLFYGA